MSAQFTPGPWHYRPNEHDDWGFVRASPTGDRPGGVICQARDPAAWWDNDVQAEHRRNSTDPFEANARLIAAAPELFEALKGLTSYAEAVRHTAGMGKSQLARLEAAKAALAKVQS